MRGNNKKGGFTLVELIVVIVIILVLAAVLVPSVMKYISSASKAKCAETKQSLATEMLADIMLNDEIPQEGVVTIPTDMESRYKCPSDGTYTAKYESGIINISCDVHDEGKKPGEGGGYTPVKVAASAKDYEAPLNAIMKTLYDSIVADRLKDDKYHISYVQFDSHGNITAIKCYDDEADSKKTPTNKTPGDTDTNISVEERNALSKKIKDAVEATGYKIDSKDGAKRIFFDWNGNAISGTGLSIAGQGVGASMNFQSLKGGERVLITNTTGEWEKQ